VSVRGGDLPGEHRQQSTNLADILERVLDKGIVIAGDIRVNLPEIELHQDSAADRIGGQGARDRHRLVGAQP
jgi:hypothetical protein